MTYDLCKTVNYIDQVYNCYQEQQNQEKKCGIYVPDMILM